jgi:hypothetical protein
LLFFFIKYWYFRYSPSSVHSFLFSLSDCSTIYSHFLLLMSIYFISVFSIQWVMLLWTLIHVHRCKRFSRSRTYDINGCCDHQFYVPTWLRLEHQPPMTQVCWLLDRNLLHYLAWFNTVFVNSW